MEEISITFLKEGKIVHTVADYGNEGPDQLVWAYGPLHQLVKQTQWVSMPTETPTFPNMQFFRFERGAQSLALAKSESFWLWMELQGKHRPRQALNAPWRLTSSQNFIFFAPPGTTAPEVNQQEIITDGRVFQFVEGTKVRTYELGYNFLERNFAAEINE